MLGALCLILITFFIPPIGVLLVAGCGADFCINICLTLLGYIPGHIHAYYLEYQYYHRKELIARGEVLPPASGIYSDHVQQGGYGTMDAPRNAAVA